MTTEPTTVTVTVNMPGPRLPDAIAARINAFAADLEAAGVDDVIITLDSDA
jgi:hypothetical protein